MAQSFLNIRTKEEAATQLFSHWYRSCFFRGGIVVRAKTPSKQQRHNKFIFNRQRPHPNKSLPHPCLFHWLPCPEKIHSNILLSIQKKEFKPTPQKLTTVILNEHQFSLLIQFLLICCSNRSFLWACLWFSVVVLLTYMSAHVLESIWNSPSEYNIPSLIQATNWQTPPQKRALKTS